MLVPVVSTRIVMIDFQPRILAAMQKGDSVLANAEKLAKAATLFDVSLVWTEQNPGRLGSTHDRLKPALPSVMAKTTFDVSGLDKIADTGQGEAETFILAGVEAHVCVLQSALGFLRRNKTVYVVADAVSSRNTFDFDCGLDRMRQAGARVVTTEMILFEWLRSSDHPAFKQVQAMIK